MGLLKNQNRRTDPYPIHGDEMARQQARAMRKANKMWSEEECTKELERLTEELHRGRTMLQDIARHCERLESAIVSLRRVLGVEPSNGAPVQPPATEPGLVEVVPG